MHISYVTFSNINISIGYYIIYGSCRCNQQGLDSPVCVTDGCNQDGSHNPTCTGEYIEEIVYLFSFVFSHSRTRTHILHLYHSIGGGCSQRGVTGDQVSCTWGCDQSDYKGSGTPSCSGKSRLCFISNVISAQSYHLF